MAAPTVTWLANITSNDGVNSGDATGGAGGSSSNWLVLDNSNDKFMFTSEEQNDGDSTSGTLYPVPIPSSGDKEAPKTFIWDNSASELKQVPLAGTTLGMQDGGNNRYVFCTHLSGATASTPYLEAWDSYARTSTDNEYLNHSGSSLIKAIGTTSAAPGSDTWSGVGLQGTTSRISLYTGAVPSAMNLYFNMKLVVPSTFTAQTYTSAIIGLRFLYS